MKLSECKHGIIVIAIERRKEGTVGMVVGITQNAAEEAIPLIQWQDGETTTYHHSDLELYEG